MICMVDTRGYLLPKLPILLGEFKVGCCMFARSWVSKAKLETSTSAQTSVEREKTNFQCF